MVSVCGAVFNEMHKIDCDEGAVPSRGLFSL